MNSENDNLTKGQKTQKLIIEAALKLYGEFGFNQTSIQMIANACELSQGAVMQHFKSKIRLFEGVRAFVSRSNHDFVDGKIFPTDDALESLRKHMLGNLEWALKYRSQASMIYLTYESGIYNPEQNLTAQGAARLGTERIHRFLLSAQRERLVPSGGPIETQARILQEYLLGMILRVLNEVQGAKIPKEIVDRVDLCIQSICKPMKPAKK